MILQCWLQAGCDAISLTAPFADIADALLAAWNVVTGHRQAIRMKAASAEALDQLSIGGTQRGRLQDTARLTGRPKGIYARLHPVQCFSLSVIRCELIECNRPRFGQVRAARLREMARRNEVGREEA